jgi:hypothetical protein
MGGTYDTHGRDEKFIHFSIGIPGRKRPFGKFRRK